MVQRSVIIFGVLTFAICVTLLLLTIFIFADTIYIYESNDKVTNSKLSNALYENINNFYMFQCYGYAFEIYTNLGCENYLKANMNNQQIKYYNDQCYSETGGNQNSTCPGYNDETINKFCTFFKNPNFCNVYGY